jgi:hypothetical protein
LSGRTEVAGNLIYQIVIDITGKLSVTALSNQEELKQD